MDNSTAGPRQNFISLFPVGWPTSHRNPKTTAEIKAALRATIHGLMFKPQEYHLDFPWVTPLKVLTLLVLALLAGTTFAHAAVGTSLVQSHAMYGNPIVSSQDPKTNLLQEGFQKENTYIQTLSENGTIVCVLYMKKAPEMLSDADVTAILELHGALLKYWRETPNQTRFPKMRIMENSMSDQMAVLDPETRALFVCTKTFYLKYGPKAASQ